MSGKNRNVPLWSICIVAASLGCAAGAQAADDSGWYIGAGIGRSNARDLGNAASTLDASLATQGITSSTLFGSTNTAWKLFGGYQFNQYFGVEGGYSNLGQFPANSAVTAPAPDTGSGTLTENNVWSLAAIGSAPILDKFSVFGKLGIAYSTVDFNYVAPVSGVAISQSSSQTEPLFGIGLKYEFNNHVGLRGEWERYLKVGNNSTIGGSDVDLWNMSLQYRF